MSVRAYPPWNSERQALTDQIEQAVTEARDVEGRSVRAVLIPSDSPLASFNAIRGQSGDIELLHVIAADWKDKDCLFEIVYY